MRHIILDGEPWFVAADVCRILYPNFNANAGVRPYMNGIDSTERRNVTRKTSQGLFEGVRGAPNLNVLSESGLYKLILRANTSNPAAKEFQQWVTKEVLPAIRKTGGLRLRLPI